MNNQYPSLTEEDRNKLVSLQCNAELTAILMDGRPAIFYELQIPHATETNQLSDHRMDIFKGSFVPISK